MNTHTHERKIPLRLLAGSGLLFSLMMPGYSQGMPGAPAKPSTVLVQKASTIDSAVNKKYIGQVESIDRVTVQPPRFRQHCGHKVPGRERSQARRPPF